MINSEKFIERLKEVMDFYELNASSFADKIDVQRSSISHILSGRNKPSLDFILKILESFDQVDLYWLLNGKGVFPKNATASTLFTQSNISSRQSKDEDVMTSKKQTISPITSEKSIRKIVIFYSDGTFEDYSSTK